MKTTGLTIVNPLPLNYTDVAFTTVSRKIIAKVGFALLLGAFTAFHVLNMTSNTRQTACERSKRNHMLITCGRYAEKVRRGTWNMAGLPTALLQRTSFVIHFERVCRWWLNNRAIFKPIWMIYNQQILSNCCYTLLLLLRKQLVALLKSYLPLCYLVFYKRNFKSLSFVLQMGLCEYQ